ncbi:hypothetical protein WG66_014134 [Moniliophthora roreri]|nr:hypothetical protein WG66_014134 [Moniliophthora roreri]
MITNCDGTLIGEGDSLSESRRIPYLELEDAKRWGFFLVFIEKEALEFEGRHYHPKTRLFTIRRAFSTLFSRDAKVIRFQKKQKRYHLLVFTEPSFWSALNVEMELQPATGLCGGRRVSQ